MPRLMYIVTFGFYFPNYMEGSYSYWDYEIAMETFLDYQQMGCDFISFEPYGVTDIDLAALDTGSDYGVY